MTSSPQTLLFLPGMSADGSFWRGVGNRLPESWEKTYLNWPGLGNQPADPGVQSFSDLVALAEQALVKPSALVAQSMGGWIALQVALKHPDLATHLVLAGTSAGLDLASFGAVDWRPEFLKLFPNTPEWALTKRPDLTKELDRLNAPTLLIWGAEDEISPPAVGAFLAERIEGARLEVVAHAGHGMGMERPEPVAELILEFLTGV